MSPTPRDQPPSEAGWEVLPGSRCDRWGPKSEVEYQYFSITANMWAKGAGISNEWRHDRWYRRRQEQPSFDHFI